MTGQGISAVELDAQLMEHVIKNYYSDPYGFVAFAFDWGKGDLAGFDGPDQWQTDFLKNWGDKIRAGGFDGVNAVEAIREATASGHGVGKSALVSWAILFIMSTRPFCKGVVTANTSAQLETKTWAELVKWHKRCITGHWFEARASMKLVHAKNPETWRCDFQTCREENSESFAGLHAADSTPFYIFDEASAVPDIIWEVAEGGLTDGEPMFLVFGNPTRNSGKFRECFGRYKHRWGTRQVDSRTAKFPNRKQIDKWIEDYGEDSDFVRVRVRGVFPRAGSMQFISSEIAEFAGKREGDHSLRDPRIMGVDVARFGDDQSVIFFRIGRDAKTYAPLKFRGIDTMSFAARIVEEAEKHKIDAIFIDGGGVGGGVVDRLRMLQLPVVEVQFGGKADRNMASSEGTIVYANKRAEMWGLMRDWLATGAIPDDPELLSDLSNVEYGYVMKEGRDAIMLERKADMKKRGLSSPDVADALALTFAYPVAHSDHSGRMSSRGRSHQVDFDPYADMWSAIRD